jgi:hypothetical protein
MDNVEYCTACDEEITADDWANENWLEEGQNMGPYPYYRHDYCPSMTIVPFRQVVGDELNA